ncbi:hypothetical protein FB451DRAFT_1397463 [Mycena latifolia]|nr:hypothetical protein FB451DRAFT_1397463 [Mycena latifolia]
MSAKHERSASSEVPPPPESADPTVGAFKRRRAHEGPPSIQVPESEPAVVFTRRRSSPPSLKCKSKPTSDSEDDAANPPKKKKSSKTHGPPRPQRPPGGRPSHSARGIRKDNAPAATLTGLDRPQTPPPKRPKTKTSPKAYLSPGSSRVAGFTTLFPAYLQGSPPKVVGARSCNSRSGNSSKSASKSKGNSSQRFALKKIKDLESDGWVSAGDCLMVDTYKKFESWKNDYHPKYSPLEPSVKMIQLGNPCDRPRDIRARKWILAWDTPDHNPPSYLVGKKVVMRYTYHCTGHCKHGNTSLSSSDSGEDDVDAEGEEDEEWQDEDKPGYVEVSEESSAPESAEGSSQSHDENSNKSFHDMTIPELNSKLNQGSRKKVRPPPKRTCKVVIHAEVYSDDLTKIHFFQRHKHPEALVQYLDSSQYICQCMLEMARMLGLSPASIKRRLLQLFVEDEKHPTPSYRRPSATQVNNVVNNARRKERLLSDPLLSIDVFARKNPDKIFHYTPPNYTTDPPREFSTGIHHIYGTQVMLLWAWLYGIGHDSTYRHMNENRAPLTIMITLDTFGRMVPGFAHLSGDTTTETQVLFLQEVKQLVEQMAADLVAGKFLLKLNI